MMIVNNNHNNICIIHSSAADISLHCSPKATVAWAASACSSRSPSSVRIFAMASNRLAEGGYPTDGG